MSKKEFKIGDIIVIKGMRDGESFDPKILLINSTSRSDLRCYINVLLLNLIQQTKPFTGVKEIKLLPISIIGWGEESEASLAEIEAKDFFERRTDLTTEEFLWATSRLLFASDNPDTKNPPLLNKQEFATFLIMKEAFTMFQLIGSYNIRRGWSCNTFDLSKIKPENKTAPMINRVLLPCN
ncbi:MAG: hypothetical protein WC582_02410 [Patescibacteria group bacterium]